MGLNTDPSRWQAWRDFAPLYLLVNLPLIIVAAALMAYLPPEQPACHENGDHQCGAYRRQSESGKCGIHHSSQHGGPRRCQRQGKSKRKTRQKPV